MSDLKEQVMELFEEVLGDLRNNEESVISEFSKNMNKSLLKLDLKIDAYRERMKKILEEKNG